MASRERKAKAISKIGWHNRVDEAGNNGSTMDPYTPYTRINGSPGIMVRIWDEIEWKMARIVSK